MPNKRVNLSEILAAEAAEQEAAQKHNTVTEQNANTVKPQSVDITLPKGDKTAIEQSNYSLLSQDPNKEKLQESNTASPEGSNALKPQTTRKTDERIKATYYLDPEQADKLEDLRIEYRKATGQRLNEQNFMRLIIERLDLQALL